MFRYLKKHLVMIIGILFIVLLVLACTNENSEEVTTEVDSIDEKTASSAEETEVSADSDMQLQQLVQSHANRFRMDLIEDDKLNVILCGTGAPPPSERAQSCTAILTKDTFLVFDVGGGTAKNMDWWNLPLPQLDAIFLTHLHSDHMLDLPELSAKSWELGRQEPLQVFGPEETGSVVNGVRELLLPDANIRSELEGSPIDVAFPIGHDIKKLKNGEKELVYENGNGLEVYAFTVDHPPWESGFGYRIEYKEQSVVISGDTKKNDNLTVMAEDADLLIHEAYNKKVIDEMINAAKSIEDKNEGIEKFIERASNTQDYHTTPEEAGGVAKSANVEMLILNHLIPPDPSTTELMKEDAQNAFDGEVVIGDDGMHFILEEGEISTCDMICESDSN